MKQYSWMMTDRQLCDIEMILDKSFNPLNHFMNEDDYKGVLNDMRLATGELFPFPITLDVDKQFSKKVSIGEKIILREKEGFKVASMIIEVFGNQISILRQNLYTELLTNHILP